MELPKSPCKHGVAEVVAEVATIIEALVVVVVDLAKLH
jgi:hypothetical protein